MFAEASEIHGYPGRHTSVVPGLVIVREELANKPSSSSRSRPGSTDGDGSRRRPRRTQTSQEKGNPAESQGSVAAGEPAISRGQMPVGSRHSRRRLRPPPQITVGTSPNGPVARSDGRRAAPRGRPPVGSRKRYLPVLTNWMHWPWFLKPSPLSSTKTCQPPSLQSSLVVGTLGSQSVSTKMVSGRIYSLCSAPDLTR